MLSQHQKEMRRIGLGGSDIGPIAGCKDAFSTPLDIYLNKVGATDNNFTNQAMMIGNLLEAPIAGLYEKTTGKVLIEPSQMYIHPEHPFMLANPDRLIKEDNGLLECKNVRHSKRSLWGAPGTDEIPDTYLLQVAHYAYILNASYVDIAVLFGGVEFEIFHYEPNKKLEEKILQIAENFWNNHVLKQMPPDPVSYKETIKRWPIAEKHSDIYADDNALGWYHQLREIKKQLKDLQQQEDLFKKEIASYMQDKETLIAANDARMISWKERTTSRLDIEFLKEQQPEIYQKYLKSSSSRTMIVHYAGEEE